MRYSYASLDLIFGFIYDFFKDKAGNIVVFGFISSKNKGLTRNQLVEITRMHNSGRLTLMLAELKESGFVQAYRPFGKNKRDMLYRLSDFYTSFYFRFIKDAALLDENNWINAIESGTYQSWKGFAFEQVCLSHIRQIKKALAIQGIVAAVAAWQNTDKDGGAQIDLLIDRNDRVINVFELKFSENPYTLTSAYAVQLTRKIAIFKEKTQTRKSVQLAMLTPFGVLNNAYSSALLQHNMTMDVLFE